MVEDIRRLIGVQIRKLRKERGMSQEELGYRSELHYTHIGAIERGEKNWSIDTLIKIAKGLHVEIVELFPTFPPPSDSRNLKESLHKGINASSPEVMKIVSDLLKGLKVLEAQSNKQKRTRKL